MRNGHIQFAAVLFEGKSIARFLWVMIAYISLCLVLKTATLQAQDSEKATAFLKQHCVRCHGADASEGDVRLDRFAQDDSELYGKIYEQLSSLQMPPDDEAQPTDAARKRIASHFLNLAETSNVPNTASLRRLNRREYRNTVRDLLGLGEGIFDPAKFIYKDEVVEGFDTRADSLITSNELLLEYLQAAQLSLQQALFTLEPKQPKPAVTKCDLKKMSGASRRYETKSPEAYVFRVGKSRIRGPGMVMRVPGRYRITVTASAIDKKRYSIPFRPVNEAPVLGIGIVSSNRSSVSEFDHGESTFPLKYNKEQTFKVDKWIDRGFLPYLQFVNGSRKPVTQIRSGLRRGNLTKAEAKGEFLGPGIRITQFKIEGPFFDIWPPQSVRTTIDRKEIPDLKKSELRLFLLGRFAKRAFRRKVNRKEMRLWMDYLNKRYAASRNWREAFIETMSAMMASPDFLFLPANEEEIDDFQLASRLSYFFWSTMPDPDLFTLADSGKLRAPEVLQQQVDKMLKDPRSQRFCDSFVDQWLALDTLGTMPPDEKLFGFYNKRLEVSMKAETREFFRHVLQKNRSVREFIDSDYTFLNGSLGKLYKIPVSKVNKKNEQDMTLTKLPRDSVRGGILGHASVLTLTSNGVETSPVTRGVWVLEHFMGTPPPPAPEEVPALVPDLNGAQSVRQLLEKHRSDSACMKCHQRMDPLGFALESFDPVGRFRTKYSKRQLVSTEGRFMGKYFRDLGQLKKILIKNDRPFARNLIVRIAEYAKGRELVAADYPTVETILKQTEKRGFKLRDIVYEIAISDLMTRN